MGAALVVGDINVDLAWELPFHPAPGDDCTAIGLRQGAGGGGLNAAAAFALLGARVELVARLGTDPAGEMALAFLARAGVGSELVERDSSVATGLCSVAVGPDGQRTFFSFRGANVGLTGGQAAEAALDRAELLFVAGHALLEGPQLVTASALGARATERQLPRTLDLALPLVRRAPELIDAWLPGLWLLTLNEDELAALRPGLATELALTGLLAAGVQRVALKRGAAGCLLAEVGQPIRAVAAPTVVARDTTGCGDAFAATCALSLLRGESFESAAALANAVGAATATRPGAAEALPSRAELTTLCPALPAWLTAIGGA